MMVLVLWGIVIGLTVLGAYFGLIVLFGKPDTDELDFRIQRVAELKTTHRMLRDLLGREPSTKEIWASAPEHIN